MQRLNCVQFSFRCDYTILLLFSLSLCDCTEALSANASAYRPNSNVPEIVFDWIERLMRRFVNVFRQFIHSGVIVLCLMSESFTRLKRNFCSYSVGLLVCWCQTFVLIKTAQWLGVRIEFASLNWIAPPLGKSLFNCLFTPTQFIVCLHHIKERFFGDFCWQWPLLLPLFFIVRLKCVQRECSNHVHTHSHLQWKSIILNICSVRSTPFQCYRCQEDCIPCTHSLNKFSRFSTYVRFLLLLCCWAFGSCGFSGRCVECVETTTQNFYGILLINLQIALNSDAHNIT